MISKLVMIKRLCRVRVPVFSKNLIDHGIITSSLNDELVRDALNAFTAYSEIRHEKNFSGIKGKRKRSRLSRGARKSQQSVQKETESESGPTLNDFFFEHQRINGYTNGTPFLAQSVSVQNLSGALLIEAEKYLNLLGGVGALSIPPLIQNGVISLNMWAAVQKGRRAYHKDHVHDGVIVSGVYYAKTPPACSPLVFHKPILQPDGSIGYRENSETNPTKLDLDLEFGGFGCQPDYSNHDANNIVVIKPKEGQMILFPPWLLHGVPKVELKAEEPRVSFAFNVGGAYAAGDPWKVTQESIIKEL